MSLRNRTILVTRPRGQAEETVRALAALGGTAVVVPMIAIGPPASWKECDDAIARLGEFDAVAVASVNAAESFFGRAILRGVGERLLAGVRALAVGERTAEAARSFGVTVETVPGDFSGRALAVAIGSRFAGRKILLPRGNLAREELAELLRGSGAVIDAVTVYSTSGPAGLEAGSIVRRVLGGEFDVVTFASPSAAKNFCSLFVPRDLSAVPDHARIAVIGPTTADAVRGLGLPVDIVARESTAAGFARSIDEFFL